MADGLFGGIAEGISSAQQQRMQQQYNDAQIGLGQQRLKLEQQRMQNEQQRELMARADKDISTGMDAVTKIIEAGRAKGTDTAQIYKTIEPMLGQIKQLAASAGRKNASAFIDAQVAAAVSQPTPGELPPTREDARPVKIGGGGLEGDVYGSFNPKTHKYEPIQQPQPELNPPSNTGPRPPGQNMTDQNATVVSREPTQQLDDKGNVIEPSQDPPALASIPPKYRDLVRG